MNIIKPRKGITIFVICLAAAALATLNYYQHRQIQHVRRSLSPDPVNSIGIPTEQSAVPSTPDSTVAPGSTGDNDVDNLVYQIDSAEEELAMVQEQLAADETKKAQRKALLKELQRKSIENPSFESNYKSSLDTQYADLFKKLSLSPEEMAKFEDILFNRELARHELNMEYWDMNDLSEEQQTAVANRYQSAEEDANSELASFLGENRYDVYENYLETESQRQQVTNYMGYLDSEEVLTDSQKEALIESMHDAEQNIVYEDLEPADDGGSDAFYDKNIERMKSNHSRRMDAYLKSANSVLSASQLEAFEEYLENEKREQDLIYGMISMQISASEDPDEE